MHMKEMKRHEKNALNIMEQSVVFADLILGKSMEQNLQKRFMFTILSH